MLKTLKAVLEKNGHLRFQEKIDLEREKRVLVTFLDEEVEPEAMNDAALLSESALAQDWSRPEEDAAWQHLQ